MGFANSVESVISFVIARTNRINQLTAKFLGRYLFLLAGNKIRCNFHLLFFLSFQVAMVELQINEPTAVPEWLFVMFAVCTTVLVSVHIFALMISTYLLPNIEAISKLQVSRLVTESPHERMRGFIELAWAFSTVLGLFLFLVEVAILCWVKFWDYSFTAATASTIIVIPVLIVFIAFAVHFYHSLVVYKCESSVSDMNELESIKRNLDNVTMRQSSV